MPHSQAHDFEDQALERFRSMGIEARRIRGGHCVIASMDIDGEPFPTLGESRRTTRVMFSTVGQDRIKCLRPRFLFALPILQIRGCSTRASIELRIRSAWRSHMQELKKAHEWLSHLGVDDLSAEGGAVLCFSLNGEDPAARVRMRDGKQMILPARGPLSGIALESPEHRCLPANHSVDSCMDLEIGISTRLDELTRIEHARSENRRRRALTGRMPAPGRIEGRRPHSVLLVGQRLASQTACIESLRLRGYRVQRASSEQEARACFDDLSPELVLADAQLGRSEGIDLILALRELHGVEDIPVLLVDDHHRPARRNAAREVGAAGYLTYPIDVSRIAARLAQILDEPTKRRFTRYEQRISVSINGFRRPCLTSIVGRGGMFLATNEEIPDWGVYDCEIALPGLAKALGVEAEVRYRGESRSAYRGIGMRFHAFADRDEARLIDYLRTLEDERYSIS